MHRLLAGSALTVGFLAATSMGALVGPGDIAFTGFNTDANDDLAFVALKSIGASQVIRFTDNEWNGSAIGSGGAFNTGENDWSWTAPASGLPAGTVIVLNNLSAALRSANFGTISTGAGGFNLDDECVYAYLGASGTPTAFLAAVANEDTADVSPLGNTGLTAGTNAFILSSDEDIFAYTGSRSNKTIMTDYLPQIMNVANWSIQVGGSGDQSADGIGPDVPFSSVAFTPEPASLSVLALGAIFGLRRRTR